MRFGRPGGLTARNRDRSSEPAASLRQHGHGLVLRAWPLRRGGGKNSRAPIRKVPANLPRCAASPIFQPRRLLPWRPRAHVRLRRSRDSSHCADLLVWVLDGGLALCRLIQSGHRRKKLIWCGSPAPARTAPRHGGSCSRAHCARPCTGEWKRGQRAACRPADRRPRAARCTPLSLTCWRHAATGVLRRTVTA